MDVMCRHQNAFSCCFFLKSNFNGFPWWHYTRRTEQGMVHIAYIRDVLDVVSQILIHVGVFFARQFIPEVRKTGLQTVREFSFSSSVLFVKY